MCHRKYGKLRDKNRIQNIQIKVEKKTSKQTNKVLYFHGYQEQKNFTNLNFNLSTCTYSAIIICILIKYTFIQYYTNSYKI